MCYPGCYPTSGGGFGYIPHGGKYGLTDVTECQIERQRLFIYIFAYKEHACPTNTTRDFTS